MTTRTFNWGSGLHDRGLDIYIPVVSTTDRHLCHTTAAGDPKKHPAERFVCPNSHESLHDDLRRTEEIDPNRQSHLTLDMHFGPGHNYGPQDGHDPSPVLTRQPSGKPVQYHRRWGIHPATGKVGWIYWIAEGGIRPALEQCFRWIPNYPSIQIFELFNEPLEADWLVDHARDHGWYDLAAEKCQKAGLLFLGPWGDGGWTELSREYCGGLVVHAIGTTPAKVTEKLRRAKADAPGMPIYLTELTAADPEHTEAVIRAALAEGVEDVGGFLGDRQHFPKRNFAEWNGKSHRTFVQQFNGGRTDVGDGWWAVFGDDSAPPPTPPPDPVPPPKPPPEPGTNYVKRAKARQVEMADDFQELIDKHDLAKGSPERVKFRRARAAHRDTVAVTEELESG